MTLWRKPLGNCVGTWQSNYGKTEDKNTIQKYRLVVKTNVKERYNGSSVFFR